MMSILAELKDRHADNANPFLVSSTGSLYFRDLEGATSADMSDIDCGDVVALIGDFEPESIVSLLALIDKGVVLVPLTMETEADHEYFFDAAGVDFVVKGQDVKRIRDEPLAHPHLEELRASGHAGLVLFSSGTTGRPKAILHDMTSFLVRYRTQRPALRTLNFLLFDHIGGINTLLHTLFNCGTVVIPSGRAPEAIFDDIATHNVELFPTTPTFLRWMLMGGFLNDGFPPVLKIVTYGTERMDQVTLDRLCELCPDVEFRQTFGMSELGILRVKTRSKDSLWMLVGGEGVETKTVDGVLKIRSKSRMIGYLNAPSPFDDEGWYDTKDLVEEDGDWIRVVGRTSEVINVGGLKILPKEVERAVLQHPDVLFAKASGAANPITGEHIELTCQLREGATLKKSQLRAFLKDHLLEQFVPHKIIIEDLTISHRFKKL
jgi:acyl-CoA synthetase (AMP-forming)/AMP-acid ligase II